MMVKLSHVGRKATVPSLTSMLYTLSAIWQLLGGSTGDIDILDLFLGVFFQSCSSIILSFLSVQ